jgi:mRNA-degrading endonuclease toxin of MazEF toxin-antitoxin module
MDREAFNKTIDNALSTAKGHLLYFLSKDAEYGVKLSKWLAEIAAKNKFIRQSEGQKERDQSRPRKRICYFDFGVNIGSEFNYPHFAVVVKEFSHTAVIVPISSQKEDDPEWKSVDNLIIPIGIIKDLPREKRPCYAMVNQIRSISKQRLNYFKDNTTGQFYDKLQLSDPQMDLIDEAIKKLCKP